MRIIILLYLIAPAEKFLGAKATTEKSIFYLIYYA